MTMSKIRFLLLWLLATVLAASFASAELVSVSQLGHHPDGNKNVIAYTNIASGTFSIIEKSTNISFATYHLQKARDFNGNAVECQGNNPCLVGDFTGFKIEGDFYIKTSIGGKTSSFPINSNVYQSTAPLFLEFFDATLMQNSSYHADFFSGYNPPFTIMPDGSFMMEADQAALTMIRLGSAYRRNPSLFQNDRYIIKKPGKPDIQEYILIYANYLKGLQGIVINATNDGSGYRLGWGLKPGSAFVPGPTNLTNVSVYTPGNPPFFIETVPIKSLCGQNDSSLAWKKCVDDAYLYYNCEIDKPCVNFTYFGPTGKIISNSNGYSVSRGWGPDFGCRLDLDINTSMAENFLNPCMVFNSETSRQYTVQALLGFLEALPAVYDYDAKEAQILFNRSLNTYNYVKKNYPDFSAPTDEAAFFGAAAFLLFDYTNNLSYLAEAHSLSKFVSQQLIPDHTRGNEYYWEEYIKHENEITNAGLPYQIAGTDPREFYRGKLFFDYKDAGPDKSISRTGEKIFQFDPNIQFQNSRFVIIEAIIAAKAAELLPSPENFIQLIADSQLAWLTGMNAVQNGTQVSGNPVASMSFIFGIGSFPNQFHLTMQIPSYRNSSSNSIIGAYQNTFMYRNLSGSYNYLNGNYEILGKKFGTLRYPLLKSGITFSNGMDYIPGWINGAFDVYHDNDVIFNYEDNRNAYSFTETTNEIVASAIELYAYLDGRYNGKQPYPQIIFANESSQIIFVSNNTQSNTANSTNFSNLSNSSCYSSLQNIPAKCNGGIIVKDSNAGCRSIVCSSGASNLTILACDKPTSVNPTNFEMYKQNEAGMEQLEICIGQSCIKYNGYEKSANYPICLETAAQNLSNSTNTTPAPPANTTQQPANTSNVTSNAPQSSNTTSSNEICYSRVNDIPVACTAEITQDVKLGCRTIECGSSGSSIKVMACEKPDSGAKQYFEMYRQSSTGIPPKLCMGKTCMQNEGYVKSSNYPMCISANNASSTNTTQTNETTSNQTLPQANATQSTNQAESNSGSASLALSIAPWFPQGRSYVFKCTANGFVPALYDWIFGDGNKQLNSQNNDVYHTYSAAGNYEVRCNAKNTSTSIWSSLNITVT